MDLNPKFSDKAKVDFDLVEKAQKGNQAAFTKLMDRYYDSIYFMVLKMVNNQSDAEDLTIEAFGKAFKKIDQYSPSFAFSTWLFRIASNNCIDHMRKNKGKQISILNATSEIDDTNGEAISEESSLSIQSDLPDPEEALINDQKRVLMRELVDALKPRYRQLVELRYFKEYSYEEISEEMELPLGTVKAQLFRARELLYGILEKRQGVI